MKFGFLVLFFVLLGSSANYAVPAPPSPVCDIKADILSVLPIWTVTNVEYQLTLNVSESYPWSGQNLDRFQNPNFENPNEYCQKYLGKIGVVAFNDFDPMVVFAAKKVKATVAFRGDEWSHGNYFHLTNLLNEPADNAFFVQIKLIAVLVVYAIAISLLIFLFLKLIKKL